MVETRNQPQAKDKAEQNILGYIFLHPQEARFIFERVPKPEMFNGIHARIYECYLAINAKGEEITAASVMSWFEKNQGKAPADLLVYLTKCMDTVEFELPDTIYGLCKIVTDGFYSKMFQYKAKGVTGLEDALNVSQQVFSWAGERHETQRSPALILSEILSRQKAIYDGSIEAGYEWGLKSLDNLLQIRPGCLYTIGGIKKGGKTLFLLSLIDHNLRMSTDRGLKIPVLFFSLEMSDEETYLRLLAKRAGVHSDRLFTKYLGRDDFQRIGQAADTLTRADLVVEDAAGLTLPEILIRTRLWKEQFKVPDGSGIVAVDFLQLITHPNKRDSNRAEEIKDSAYALQRLAKSLKVAVIQLAQLHNAAEGEKPEMRHLEGSGGIAQASEAIILLDLVRRRDKDAQIEGDSEPFNVIVAGQRRGASGETVKCRAKLATGEFFEEYSV